MNNINIKTLRSKIKLYYKKKSRALPWRVQSGYNQNPYKTLDQHLCDPILRQFDRIKINVFL